MPDESLGLVAVEFELKRTVIVPVESIVRTKLLAHDVSQLFRGHDPSRSSKKTRLPHSQEKK